MLLYCLKFKKIAESKNPKVEMKNYRRIMHYQSIRFAIIKNQALSKSQKLVDY